VSAAPESPNRLRRILEAYGGSSAPVPAASPEVPPPAPSEMAAPVVASPAEPLPIQSQLARGRAYARAPIDDPLLDALVAESLEVRRPEIVSQALAVAAAPESSAFKMRFEELGLSLSRFPEVRGFALWQAGQSSHTGDLGFDVELSVLKLRLERMLEGAIQVQGAQDGFSSVTLNHAKGGMSVFGSGTALVAVAHQHDGLPSHLRAWMCGWVSQPLRG
jgi:hypothetical protein